MTDGSAQGAPGRADRRGGDDRQRPVDRLGSVDDMVARVLALQAEHGGRRVLLGLAGEPGGGKSTVAADLVEGLGGAGVDACTVPMDGFHLAGASLARLGRLDRKGAIDTFDADGYLALLDRLREAPSTVWAPEYVRGLEECVGGAIEVDPAVQVVVSEGNYLLADPMPWPEVARRFDEVWFVDTPADLRLGWLVDRHVRFGMSQEAALAWATGPDEANARLVRSTRSRADAVVDARLLWLHA